ncbi:DUF6538 domain-containing protein [Roseibium sp.]|uniref:DUF6538 domain-containing protein n=1 Tax=Roseibium sp. TaxID=1936156 RepID=UPI003BAC329D
MRYLTQRSSGFRFQVRIPCDLESIYGKTPIRISLGLIPRMNARRLSRLLLGRSEEAFSRTRLRKTMSAQHTSEIDERDQLISELQQMLVTVMSDAEAALEMAEERRQLELKAQSLRFRTSELEQQRAMSEKLSPLGEAIQQLKKTAGELKVGLGQKAVSAGRELSPLEHRLNHLETMISSLISGSPPKPMLSSVLAKWSETKISQGVARKNVNGQINRIKNFIDFAGDRPLNDYKFLVFQEYSNLLGRVPANWLSLPQTKRGNQVRPERVDEPARSTGSPRRTGSDRSDVGADGRDQKRRSDDQRTSRTSKRAARNRLTGAKIRSHMVTKGHEKRWSPSKNHIAEGRLRRHTTPADIMKIKDFAAYKARQRFVQRQISIARLRKIDALSFRERVAALFRSRRMNFERMLDKKIAAAEAVIQNSKAEPKELLNARHAASATNVARGKADAALTIAQKRLDEHYQNKPSWLRMNAWRTWKAHRARLTDLRNKAAVTRNSATSSQVDARTKLELLKTAWRNDPKRRLTEKSSKAACSEARRSLALLHEVRRLVKDNPGRANLKFEALLGVANQALELKDFRRDLEREFDQRSKIGFDPKP